MRLYSENLFDLTATRVGEMLRGRHPWELLGMLGVVITALGESLPRDAFEKRGENVWISRSARVASDAVVLGPAIIDMGTEIRHGAYIRGSALIGQNCVIGNSTEVKNAIFMDGATAPHFNYVGDSVLGRGVHLGAGVILSNLRGDGREVIIRTTPPIETHRRKVGAMLGDGVNIGCNAVINPGTILGRYTRVLPLVSVTGVWEAESLIRTGVI